MFLYFENKLNPKKKEKITEHLKGCAWCMSEYKNGEQILNVMRGSYPKKLPEGLHKNIMQEEHGLRSYDEERKKEVKFMFGLATRRVGLVLASFLTVCVLPSGTNVKLSQAKLLSLELELTISNIP